MSARVLVLDPDGSRGAAVAGLLSLDGSAAALARSFAHAEVIVRRGPVAVLIAVDGEGSRVHDWLASVRAAESAFEPDVAVLAVLDGGPIADVLYAGADDAVGADVSFEELRARVWALSRRRGRPHGYPLRIGDLVVDLRAREARISGTVVQLRRLEFELLAQLAPSPDRVVPRAELMRALWGGLVHSRTLDAHASRLRTRLARAGAPGLVVASRGVGYRLR